MASDGDNTSVFSLDASEHGGNPPILDPTTLNSGGSGGDDSGSGGADSDEWLRDADGNILTGPSGRRLRPPGWRKRNRDASTGGATQKKATLSVGVAEGILVSVHMMLASATKSPELLLEDKEAKELATAVVEVEKLYSRTVFDPKIAAWLNLSMVAGAIYIPRVVNIRTRIAAERKQPARVSEDPNQIMQFPGFKPAS